jgi:hypothetical protein
MRGITVTLYTKTADSTDPFGAPVYTETAVTVDNVLVGQPDTDDITSSTDLYGKRIDYMLGIPKGDTHDWTDKRVEWTDAYGRTVKCETFGFPITGVEHLVPTPWHMKVRCCRIE